MTHTDPCLTLTEAVDVCRELFPSGIQPRIPCGHLFQHAADAIDQQFAARIAAALARRLVL